MALAACLALCVSSTALADDKAAAEALFQEAKKLSADGDHASACPKFEASFQLDKQLGTLMNLADCLETTSQVASAWAHWNEATEWAKKQGDKRLAYIDGRKKGVASRLPKIIVRVTARTKAAAQLTVRRGDTVVRPASFGIALPSDPGKVSFSVWREDEKLHEEQVIAAEGKETTLRLDLDAIATAHPGVDAPLALAPPATPIAPAAPPYSPLHRNTGIIVGGAGIAATLAAIGFQVGAVVKKGQADEPDSCVSERFCTPQGFEAAEQARRFADIGQWLGVGGLAALAIGATVFATAPKAPDRDTAASIQLRPWAGKNRQGGSLRLTW